VRLSLILSATALFGQTHGIVLEDRAWKVNIDPSTLAAAGRTADGKALPISDGVAGLGAVTDLQRSAAAASWNLPAQQIHVAARMDQGRLFVEIASARPRDFTWPVVAASQEQRGIILPRGEGLYIPVGEKRWREFASERPFQTMEDLSMPLWGVDYGDRSLTCVLTNPLDNFLSFEPDGAGLRIRLTHHFPRNDFARSYGLIIVPGGPSAIEPARIFRQWLVETGQFVGLKEKLANLPELEKLFGAAHVYLWADGVMDAEDVRDWPALLAALRHPGNARAGRIVSLLPSDARRALAGFSTGQPVSAYRKTEVIAGLNAVIQKPDLYQPATWLPASLPVSVRPIAEDARADRPLADIVKLNGCLLNAAFPGMLAPSNEFGSGISPKMIHRLQAAGFERLWLGVPDLDVLRQMPETAIEAKSAGYLFATYDSYHSIHPPGAARTWETAQFDQALYDHGSIVGADGRRDGGFQGVGSHLSSVAAKPYLERRVGTWMKQFGFNSYFVDCDATGELFANYSAEYPQTKQMDMELRLRRLAWIRDTYHVVIGSEVGAYFAAPVIHFGHGMMTPVFGWGDPLLHDAKSPWFLGRYYPPGGPAIFFRQTVLPDKYRDIFFDPRYRLPLYQAAFHDSIVTTHHWLAPSTKFTNTLAVNELLELLYGVPPLYHLNLAELTRRRSEMRTHYSFFSPNYRKLPLLPLSEFAFLTADRLVQETEFGGEARVIANFSDAPYVYQGRSVPPAGILLVWEKTGQQATYVSQYEKPRSISEPRIYTDEHR
jgi:hypothetical protein